MSDQQRYEVRPVYGRQDGSHGVYDTRSHSWVHVHGLSHMSERDAYETAERYEAESRRQDADEAAATRTTRCLYCGARPNEWCRGKSRYHDLPFVPRHPHTARMKMWHAQRDSARADLAGHSLAQVALLILDDHGVPVTAGLVASDVPGYTSRRADTAAVMLAARRLVDLCYAERDTREPPRYTVTDEGHAEATRLRAQQTGEH